MNKSQQQKRKSQTSEGSSNEPNNNSNSNFEKSDDRNNGMVSLNTFNIRRKKPFESNELKLNFNHWMSHYHATSDHMFELIRSMQNNSKSSIISENFNPGGSNLVIISIDGLKSDLIQEQIDRFPYFRQSSSFPYLTSLNYRQNNDKLYIWNYFDVDHNQSLLLWPKVSMSPIENIFGKEIMTVFQRAELQFQFDQNKRKGQLVMSPSIKSRADITSLMEPMKLVFRESKNINVPFYKYLFDWTGTEVFGQFRTNYSSENGNYIFRLPNYEDPLKENLKPIIILFWNDNNVDILIEESGGIQFDIEKKQANLSKKLKFKSINLGNPNRPTLELNLTSFFPLKIPRKYTDQLIPVSVTSSFENDVITLEKNEASPGSEVEAKEEKKNDSETQEVEEEIGTILTNDLLKESNMIALTQLKEKFSEQNFYFKLLPYLANDIHLSLVGFVPANEVPGFLDTGSSNWKNKFIISKMKPSDLEEGEEEDEKQDGKNIELNPLQLLNNKLLSKAFQYVSPLSVSNLFPLDLCALDCEMCSTNNGLELTRITIVHPIHGIILDSLVKPKDEILEYHTEFSGITEGMLDDIDITHMDIQTILREMISAQTIIIGHSLDADLKILQITHRRIIDTSIIYPHPNGLPYKHSLKFLAKEFLDKSIQDNNDQGHDSCQDSIAAMELLIKKIELNGIDDCDIEQACDKMFQYRYSHQSIFDFLMSLNNEASNKSDKDKTENGTSFRIFSNSQYPDVKRWKDLSWGYKMETDPSYAFQIFEKQKTYCTSLFENDDQQWPKSKITSHLSPKELFDSMIGELQQTQDNHFPKYCFANVKYCEDILLDSNTSKSDGRKRTRTAESEVYDHISNLNNSLSQIYEKLPSGTLVMVLLQPTLYKLKDYMSMKTRFKWETNQKKKANERINLPRKPTEPENSNDKYTFEWDNSTSEAKLIEESKVSAECSVYLRYKK